VNIKEKYSALVVHATMREKTMSLFSWSLQSIRHEIFLGL
jgi:hypothetical protein